MEAVWKIEAWKKEDHGRMDRFELNPWQTESLGGPG